MKQKINLRLGLIALIAVITTAMGMTMVYYNLFQQQVQEDLKQNAVVLAETGVFQYAYASKERQAQISDRFRSGKLRITWIDADGTVLFDNDADAAALSNHIDRPEIRQALKNGEGKSTRRSDTMNMNTYYYAVLLDNGTVLRVSTEARAVTSVLLTALPVIVIIAVVILFECVLIGHLLIRKLMRPLEEMAENLEDSGPPAYRELEPFVNKIRSQHENILAAAKSRQDFTANVSHELKTPITAVLGYAELIENQLLDKESEVHIARQIKHNGNRLLSLITDIIQLSELDHRELPRKSEATDLLETARECVEELRPMAEQKAVTLTCEGAAVCINADPALIHEMIGNLVQNGIRYNKENGTVEVCTAVTEGRAEIAVRDTGIGIPADQLDRVFERFYRVDKSRSRETGGTGLGLAIVKHIAELHSAEITIRSTVGAGTEIRVRF